MVKTRNRRLSERHSPATCRWPWSYDAICPRCQAREAEAQSRLELRLLAYWIVLVGVLAVLTDTVLGGLGPLLLITLVFTWPLALVAVGLWARRRRRVVVLPPEGRAREGVARHTATRAPIGRR